VITGDSAKHAESKTESVEKPIERHENTTQKKTEPANKPQDENEINIPTVDMRKKVMRGSHKIVGYRVQAFSGGNSRLDRQKAEQASTAIKMKYPGQPVYVHFYSPHWICRVGNYRSFEEASEMLRKVKALGYHQACIVKGKITVQY
ncbi:SPOR domain-containing protein, partial [Segatella oris]